MHLSRPGQLCTEYCTTPLVGLPACAETPLQLVQSAVASLLRSAKEDTSHSSADYPSLAPRGLFKLDSSLILAYRVTTR